MFAGFKKFIVQGNAVDLAVGVIIGAAFKSVIDAIVNNVLNPLIAGIIGKPNFNDVLTFTLNKGEKGKEAVVSFGAVITQVVSFLLVALAIYFLIVAPINAMNERRKRGEEPEDEKSNEDKMVELLEQIAAK